MTTIEKLKLVLGICNNVIQDMDEKYDQRTAMFAIRDGIIDGIIDLEENDE